jgi:hypothetical protein
MNRCFPRPRLRGDRFNDGSPVLHNVIESAFAGVILSDRICADEASPTPGLQVVVRPSKPVNAEICSSWHLGISLAQFFYIRFSKLNGHQVL